MELKTSEEFNRRKIHCINIFAGLFQSSVWPPVSCQLSLIPDYDRMTFGWSDESGELVSMWMPQCMQLSVLSVSMQSARVNVSALTKWLFVQGTGPIMHTNVQVQVLLINDGLCNVISHCCSSSSSSSSSW